MVFDHYRTDHVHVSDAADDGQTDHDQQPGHPAPFHAQSDRRHDVAVRQRPVVYHRRTHNRFDDGRSGRRRLVVRVRHVVKSVPHGVLKSREKQNRRLVIDVKSPSRVADNAAIAEMGVKSIRTVLDGFASTECVIDQFMVSSNFVFCLYFPVRTIMLCST